MNLYALTSDALSEPWRLWTCHVVHHSLEHAAGNLLALAIPFALAKEGSRWRLALWLGILAPVLSLGLIPFLGTGTFVGLSALACAAWSWTALQLASDPKSAGVGMVMLLLLGAKLMVEALTGLGVIVHQGRWQCLSESHLLGLLGGLMASSLDRGMLRLVRKWVGRQGRVICS